MRSKLLAMWLLLGTLASAHGASQVAPAFPGAEGFGAETRGGRGGKVIEVTTLADHGKGSLRNAVASSGPRVVVFRIAGTIQLESDLKVSKPFITIAGQTAPGDGITLRDHALVIEADEVIVRYLRVRLGDVSRTESDAISVNAGSRIVLDHVSASWSVDETLSVSQRRKPGVLPLDQVTVQWSLIGESLNHSLHSKGDHGYGSLIRGSGGARYSFHHNLWAHHRARMPRPGNYESAADDPRGPLMDFRNNVFYNWEGSHSGYNADKDAVSRYNFIGNYYLRGPNSLAKSVAFEESSSGAMAYFADNWMDGSKPADPWSLVQLKRPEAGYRATQPFAVAAVSTDTADIAYQHVLQQSGDACFRDAVDARIIRSVQERSGGLIDSQQQVGGWPVLKSGTPYADADHDGMSDDWELEHHLDPHDARDAALPSDKEGYTNLDVFLNSLADECNQRAASVVQ